MSRRQRLVNLGIAAAIAVVAVVVILAASGGDAEPPEREAAATPAPSATRAAKARRTPGPEPTSEPTPAIEVEGGEVVGGVEELSFEEGERIRFSVTSDTADRVHVHAYDLVEVVPAGGTAHFDFPAAITGITEIELEDSGVLIAELRVEP